MHMSLCHQQTTRLVPLSEPPLLRSHHLFQALRYPYCCLAWGRFFPSKWLQHNGKLVHTMLWQELRWKLEKSFQGLRSLLVWPHVESPCRNSLFIIVDTSTLRDRHDFRIQSLLGKVLEKRSYIQVFVVVVDPIGIHSWSSAYTWCFRLQCQMLGRQSHTHPKRAMPDDVNHIWIKDCPQFSFLRIFFLMDLYHIKVSGLLSHFAHFPLSNLCNTEICSKMNQLTKWLIFISSKNWPNGTVAVSANHECIFCNPIFPIRNLQPDPWILKPPDSLQITK